jgi:hypothetical protein
MCRTFIRSGEIDYKNPKEYEIGGITVTGNEYIDPSVVIMVSNLSIGEKFRYPVMKFLKQSATSGNKDYMAKWIFMQLLFREILFF